MLTLYADCLQSIRQSEKHSNSPRPVVVQGLYGLGFLLACIYHVCHMDEAGLIASRVMGLLGPFWRSADVYMAQWLLGRMWGHALKASHPVTAGVAPCLQNPGVAPGGHKQQQRIWPSGSQSLDSTLTCFHSHIEVAPSMALPSIRNLPLFVRCSHLRRRLTQTPAEGACDAGMANTAFPALTLQSYLSKGQVTLAICSRMLLITMALTAGARIVCEGKPSKQWWPLRQGLVVTGKSSGTCCLLSETSCSID